MKATDRDGVSEGPADGLTPRGVVPNGSVAGFRSAPARLDRGTPAPQQHEPDTAMLQQRSIRNLIQDLAAWFPDAMLVVNAAHEVVGVNQTACDLFGYTPEELAGQPLELTLTHFREAARI